MSDFAIEASVPVTRHHLSKYPWPDMEHGDSILVPWSDRERANVEEGRDPSPSAPRAAAFWLERHRPGWTVSYRTEGEATRVWIFAPEEER